MSWIGEQVDTTFQVLGWVAATMSLPPLAGAFLIDNFVDNKMRRWAHDRLSGLWCRLDDTKIIDVPNVVISTADRHLYPLLSQSWSQWLYIVLGLSLVTTILPLLARDLIAAWEMGRIRDDALSAFIFTLFIVVLANLPTDIVTATTTPRIIRLMRDSPVLRPFLMLMDLSLAVALIGVASSGVWLIAALFVGVFFERAVFSYFGDSLPDNIAAIMWFPIDDAINRHPVYVSVLNYLTYGASQIPTVLLYVGLAALYCGVLLARTSRAVLLYYVRITVEEARRPEDIAVGKRTGIAISLVLLPVVIGLATLRALGVI